MQNDLNAWHVNSRTAYLLKVHVPFIPTDKSVEISRLLTSNETLFAKVLLVTF